MNNLKLDDVHGFINKPMNGFKNKQQGWLKMATIHNLKLEEFSLKNLRKKAISYQMTHYLATYSNECELDGYFIYVEEEQACFFMDSYDTRHFLHSICIPIYELTSSGALNIIPNGEGLRDTIKIGNIARAIDVIENFIN